jgi:hypothetical protein
MVVIVVVIGISVGSRLRHPDKAAGAPAPPPTTSLGKRLSVDGRRRRGGTAHRRRHATGGQGERIPPTVGRQAAIFAQRVIPSAAAR